MPASITSPIRWAELIQYAQKRQLMPTTMSTSQLQTQLPAHIRRMAQFSSRVAHAESLQLLDAIVQRIADPQLAGPAPGAYMDIERGVELLQAYLRDIGYQPPAGKAGTLQDFSSPQRLRVAIKTPVEMMRGVGQYVQSHDADVLDAFPAQELVRIKNFSSIARGTARNWPARWQSGGGSFFLGRMVALKGDPVWFAISRFGNPYPPFDYNSGMGVRDISRKEAIEMGLMAPSDPAPQVPAIPELDPNLSYPVGRFHADLAAALANSFAGAADIINGVLTWRA